MANYFNLRKFANNEGTDKNSEEHTYVRHRRFIDNLKVGDRVKVSFWFPPSPKDLIATIVSVIPIDGSEVKYFKVKYDGSNEVATLHEVAVIGLA